MMPLKDPIAEEYAQNIQAIVNQLKKTSKKGIAENAAYLVDADTARTKYNGRVGETFYLFPNKAPSQEVIDAFNNCQCYGGEVSFEQHLSHRGMTIIFDGYDLVIRKDREIFVERLSENNLHRIIGLAKERTVIDWDKAKFYFFPYKSFYFFISDSFEINAGGGRDDLKNESNWFSIPFTEDFDYTEIRQMCKDFAKEHPLVEDESQLSYTITTEDLYKSLKESNIELYNLLTAQQKSEQPTIEPQLEQQTAQPANKQPVNNSGCVILLLIMLLPSLLVAFL